MIDSGESVHFKNMAVDKHSTGGVGDKTSLILGPLVAACGIGVPMMSGRSLGHTGGTVDKLESIPGFNTQLSLAQFKEMVENQFLSFIGQTEKICPADKKIYALRDVTATVESIPLITASIMSKKIAEGAQGLVLDIKYGSGAFLKNKKDGILLAREMLTIGKLFKKRIKVFLTSMDQPLGRFAGNALEVEEVLAILKNEVHSPRGKDLYHDTRELSLQLAGAMLFLGKKTSSMKTGYLLAKKTLESGKALQKFLEVVKIQNGKIENLPKAKFKTPIASSKNGFIQNFDTEAIGWLLVKLKAGRTQLTDQIDPACGIEFLVKIGDSVKKDQPLMIVYHNETLHPKILTDLVNSITLSSKKPKQLKLISKIFN